MASITATFPSAPRGRRVYAGALFAAVACLVGISVSVFGILKHQHKMGADFSLFAPPPAASATAAAMPSPPKRLTNYALGLIAPALTLMVGVFMAMLEVSKTAQFQIEDNVLVLAKKRYPLAGATEVTRDPLVLKGARRIWGNRGLGAIRGKYTSKRVGKFDAFLTDTDHAVLVRWPDRVVAVSPADPEFFLYSARKAAGLST